MADTTFLGLMRRRFAQKSNPVDPVPWELDDKATAYEYVQSLGFRTPRFARTRSAAEALEAGNSFGDLFVVKQPNRHSTKGVYVLKRMGEGQYLELLNLRVITAKDLVADGVAPDYWLAEECVNGGIEGRPLPLDYKIYAFGGRITHVSQIDRNVTPPRVAFFDGAFIPLPNGPDIRTDESRWVGGGHLVPRHAGAMLRMASQLSASLDTRFVKVDCYDGPDGPVFGEFTFASGADDTGMVVYGERILRKLDAAMNGAEVGALSQFDIDMPKFRDSLNDRATVTASDILYSSISSGAVLRDKRYALSLVSHLAGGPTRPVFELAVNVVGCINGDDSRAFSVQRLVRSGSKLIVGKSRLNEFETKAKDFHGARSLDGNPWHTSRVAEVRLAAGDKTALKVLQDLAEGGYEHAARVVAKQSRGS